jgi:metallo-beta-lactamase class B
MIITRMKPFASILLLILVGRLTAQETHPAIRIVPLTGPFYIYITYNLYQGAKIPANGMYLVTSDGVVLFDTPWDTLQFQALVDSIYSRHHQPVRMALATHFHEDRTAGLEYYRSLGIKTFTSQLTDNLSTKTNKKRAEFLFSQDTVFQVADHTFKAIYPGEGHSPDNIIVWFDREKILYGGCLIKSAEDTDLGYLGDANRASYAATIRKVRRICRQPQYIIVGHGDWTDRRSLEHTHQMAKQLRKQL